MKKSLIIYSTTDVHTKKICEHIIDQLEGLQETVLMTISDTSQEELTKYDNIIVGASIRYGKHKKEVHEFIKKNFDAINSKKNYFFSVNAVARKDNKNTKITYSDEALKYFQEMNDNDEFMTEPVNSDYIDYLLGDVTNGTDGLDMDTSFDELDDSSDWFMD